MERVFDTEALRLINQNRKNAFPEKNNWNKEKEK